MPSTTPWAIPYPDGPTNLTALQSHFANIANAINSALTTGLGGAPRVANSDAERLSTFPAPVQGNTVVRPDKGMTEQYFGTYNVSTNPGGATPAGWYPVAGMIPNCRMGGNWSSTWNELAIGGAGLAFTEYSDVYNWHSPTVTPDRITPTIPGLYRVTLTGSMGSAGSFLRVYLNGAATSLGCSNGTSLGGGLMSGSSFVTFNGTTDYMWVTFYGSGFVGNAAMTVGLEFVEPTR